MLIAYRCNFHITLTGVLENDTFSVDKFYSEFETTYAATDAAIDTMEKNKKIDTLTHKRNQYQTYKFLYNEEGKTAMLPRCVTSGKNDLFLRRRYKKRENEFDDKKRDTTASFAKCAISYFLHRPKFKGYTIVIPVGTVNHELCLFFRMIDKYIDVIYFNPNYSETNDGAETSKNAKALLKSFNQRIRSVRAYYSPNGNESAKCSGLVWEQIFNHLVNGLSPFDNMNLDLEDFNQHTTLKSYQRHHGKKSTKNSGCLKYYEMWRKFDEMLHEVEDLAEITSRISHVLSNYYKNK